MKNRAAANAVNGNAINHIRASVLNSRADGAREEAQGIWLYGRISQPTDINTQTAGLIGWHQQYGDLWKLKLAFEAKYNR